MEKSAEISERLAALTAEVAGLRQSLALMLETQATHTEMLRALLEAATAPEGPEDRLAAALAQIAATLRDQGRQLESVEGVLRQLPADVGRAVGQGVRAALADV
jgi:ABC-type transporter Mla subunit MlaD